MTDTQTPPAARKSMDEIVALAKRRGFVYPASEIYGGINGFWDYGPLGVALKNNIRDDWWRAMVDCPPLDPESGEPLQLVGLDSAIIQNPKTWEASGHVAGFNDPMVDDKETKQRSRADHLYGLFIARGDDDYVEQLILEEREGTAQHIQFPFRTVIASTAGEAIEQLSHSPKLLKPYAIDEIIGNPIGNPVEKGRVLDANNESRRFFVQQLPLHYLTRFIDRIPSPFTQKAGTLTAPRMFNLMFETYVGAIRDDDAKAYLRPETAQGIFLNYKNVLDTMRVKVPFGIAQVGKAFRNEVTPRNFIFRSREFEQMEMEWFCRPDESLKWLEFWKEQRMNWWRSLGIDPANLRFRDHDADELAHYSKACVDVEYRYPFTDPGFGELEGIAHRGCFDLTQHQEHSKTKLEYFDQERNERYLPNVIEPASGLTRAVLVLLCEAYTPAPDRPSGMFMKFAPRLAPIKAGVFPLVRKDGMPEIARKLYLDLRRKFTCQYDEKQSIGKRYARMDEAGTPYCFTIDGDTLTDQTVTVRDRDTGGQQRIAIDRVEAFLNEKIGS